MFGFFFRPRTTLRLCLGHDVLSFLPSLVVMLVALTAALLYWTISTVLDYITLYYTNTTKRDNIGYFSGSLNFTSVVSTANDYD